MRVSPSVYTAKDGNVCCLRCLVVLRSIMLFDACCNCSCTFFVSRKLHFISCHWQKYFCKRVLKPRLDLFLLALLAPLFVHSQSPGRWLDDVKNTWWTSKACTIWPNMACVESSVKPQPTKQYRVVQMLSGHWPLWVKKMSYVSRSRGDMFTAWWD